MEGRVPAAAGYANDDPPLYLRSQSPSPPLTQPPPLSDITETYIVQIPRDQIYRVPPPQNARTVEGYRSPDRKKERAGRRKCCLWIFVILIVVAAIVAAVAAVDYLFFRPKTPEFSVTKVLVKTPTSHKKLAHPSYVISLEANNPNQRMGVSYENGGEASLSLNNKKIAGGKYPSLSQGAKASTTVHLTLVGSGEVHKNTKTSKKPVSLSLTINVPIKLEGLIDLSKDMAVTCDFKVSNLGSSTTVSSQECDTKF